jgi:molybdopterin biosynthesis enzyme MoaB
MKNSRSIMRRKLIVIKVAILTISDKCSAGEREDESGKIIDEMIQ